MILSIANQKGGCGKSVSSIFLGQFFAYIKGMKVLVIDLDGQGNTTRALIEYAGTPTMKELICDGEKLENAVLETKIKNLSIIPANETAIAYLGTYLGSKSDGAVYIRDFVEDNELDSKFDLVIIDTRPSLDILTVAPLVASRFVIVPTESDTFAAEGYKLLHNTVYKTARNLNAQVEILGVFINKYEERSNLSKHIIMSYKKGLGELFMKNSLRMNVALREAISRRKNIYIYDNRSKGAQDIAKLGDEIIDRLVQKGHLIAETVPHE